jgi:hypothetical protein
MQAASVSNADSILMRFFEENPEQRFSRKEISRKAVKRNVFEEDPRWADEALNALVARGLVEQDASGYYSLKKKRV